MKRRRFIIGVGAASVGSAGVIGTGAMSSITADRDVQLRIARDDNAYLGLDPTSELAKIPEDSGELELDLTRFNEISDGEGFNRRSVYVITKTSRDAQPGVFQITNQSDRSVKIASTTVSDVDDIEKPNEPGDLGYDQLDEDDPRIELFEIGEGRTTIDAKNPYTLKEGHAVAVGLRVIVPEGAELGSQTIHQIIQAVEE